MAADRDSLAGGHSRKASVDRDAAVASDGAKIKPSKLQKQMSRHSKVPKPG